MWGASSPATCWSTRLLPELDLERVRLNLSRMPEAERPVPEALEVDYDPCASERSG